MERIIDLGHDMARIWAQYYPAYMTGVRNTLILAFIATLAGGIIGFICGILNTIPYSKNDPAVKRGFIAFIRAIVRIYVEFFRGTPMVLQAVFIFYGLPYFTFNKVQFTGNSGIWIASLIIVSINTGAYMAESVRGGILSIDRGQTEGAMAIGMNHIQTMTSVIMPQALRNIMPQVANNFIINIKDTSVMFIIGFMDLFAQHRNIVGINYAFFPSAAIEMLIYLAMTFTASCLLRFIEKRMDGNDNYELVLADIATAAGNYNFPNKGTPFDEQNREVADMENEERINSEYVAENHFISQTPSAEQTETIGKGAQ